MANRIIDFLAPLLPGALDRIVLPDEIRLLLEHLSTEVPLPAGPAAPPIAGDAKASANDSAGGFAELAIDPLGPAIPFHLPILGPVAAPTGFQFDLEPASGLLKLPAACRPATVQGAAGQQRLVEGAAGGRVALTLNGADPLAIRIEGSVTDPARLGLVALDAAQQGLMTVGIDPPAFLLGGQGFGMHLPGGLVVDSSATAAPAPVVHGGGHPMPSEVPGWMGVALRGAELFLPPTTPLLGAGPIPIELELGLPAGLYGHTEVHVPATAERPAFDASITWDDAGATSLASALPTAIEIRTTWQLDEADVPAGTGTVELLGGRPLRVTGRFARRPGSSDMEFGLVVEAGGDQGLLTVKAADTAGNVVVTAAALATAFIADADPPNGATQPEYDGFGSTLHALLVAASGLSAFLDEGSVTIHGVGIDTGLASAGTKLTLRVDYSTDVQVQTIGLGFMSIGMKPKVPMRLRYRNVRLLVDFAQSGLDRFHLSFGEATVDVEDPGGWQVESPGTLKDLFDVLATHSGHGSLWFEIDLRFALDLGPVQVSGATVRATLGPDGALRPEIRGLDASLVMPGLFEADGQASLGDGHLDLGLTARIIPLNVAAFARLSYEDCGAGVNKLVFALGVDLPGPIPLANSGLGLYSLAGIFGVNARIEPVPAGEDPIVYQLTKVHPLEPGEYGCEPGGSVFGLGAVIGTAPDLGYTFSAGAIIVIGLPDFALRASLNGRVLAPRITFAETGTLPAGISFMGMLTVANDGVTIALRGHMEVPVLFTIDVPFGARFPRHGPDWYVRLGSDGQLGRGPGPIQARILPDILDVGAWAYLMIHGDGIPSLGGNAMLSPTGFAIGFGAGFDARYGVPLVYLEVSAYAMIALGTRPFLLAGVGHLSGSLHLGPVSIGASAEIDFLIAPALGDEWVRFEVCGEVDLFFFSLEGCVTIEIGDRGNTIPAPTDWPLESVALADHLYTKVADAVRSDIRPSLDRIPAVWPDVIPILEFTNGPARDLAPGPFTTGLPWDAAAVGDGVVGNDRLSYTYKLTSLSLTAIDPATGAETQLAGPLEAAWQEPKGGSVGEPGARELALLTWETALWTRKLVDGGKDDPSSPVPGVARRCHARAVPLPGWAVGILGYRNGPGAAWRLPTEPRPTGPYASRFEVRVLSTWWQTPLDESTVALLPLQFPLQLPSVVPLESDLPAAGRSFGGTLDLAHVVGIPRDMEPDRVNGLGEVDIAVTLTFSEPLRDPALVLLLPLWPEDYARRRLRVQLIGPGGPVAFPIRDEEPGGGDRVARTYEESGGPYFGIALAYAAALDPQVLGVRGTTATAAAAADDTNAANTASAQKTADKAVTVTPRPMLEPDTIYRIDIGLSGQGQREGNTGAVEPRTERWWFRTVDMSGPAHSKGLQYLQGTTAALALQHYQTFVASPVISQRHDAFDPVYLRRYILSWMPADKTQMWFVDDPVGVQLAVNHVADLAAAYDHDMVVRVRRTDPTRGAPDPFEEQAFPATDLWQVAVSVLQPASDLNLVALASAVGGCPYPSPGATAGGRPHLRPLSRYELYLAFPFLDSAGTGQTGGAEIRGVMFSTSRYAGPKALLAELGFGEGAPGSGLTGSLEVHQVALPSEDVADGALEQTLGRLGLGRRSVADTARSTGLWVRTQDGWALHGVLLEAPEPIHRADTLGLVGFGGRLRVGSLACGADGFGRTLRSASGDRILFLTGTPFVPSAPLSLAVTTQEVPLETAPPPVSIALSCPIAPVPSFAADLA